MKRFILFFTLFLMACPHPSAPSNGVDAGTMEAGPNDCNLDSGMVYTDATVATVSSEVHFSPKGGCQDALVSHIKGAKKSIRVQAYSFTAKPVVEALVAAGNAGKDVIIILDSSDAKLANNPIATLRAAKVVVLLDAKHLIAHNKVMIFDGAVVETGSYNYTNAAENDNAENCLFLEDSGLAGAYLTNWSAHQAHSTAVP